MTAVCTCQFSHYSVLLDDLPDDVNPHAAPCPYADSLWPVQPEDVQAALDAGVPTASVFGPDPEPCCWCGEGPNPEQGLVSRYPDGDPYHQGCWDSYVEESGGYRYQQVPPGVGVTVAYEEE